MEVSRASDLQENCVGEEDEVRGAKILGRGL